MATFDRKEYENAQQDEAMKPVQVGDQVIEPLTKPMAYDKFLDEYNNGKPIEDAEPVGPKDTFVGYAEYYERSTGRTKIVTVWFPYNIDDTKPMKAQVCLTEKGKKIVFVRNLSERARSFGKQNPVVAQEKKA